MHHQQTYRGQVLRMDERYTHIRYFALRYLTYNSKNTTININDATKKSTFFCMHEPYPHKYKPFCLLWFRWRAQYVLTTPSTYRLATLCHAFPRLLCLVTTFE
jgi:hypothetical protein